MSTVEDLIGANPFPGLRSFRPSEADRFFGREQQIDNLVARLAEVPLVAVAGTSGCGKSSLVLAGLLNQLVGLRPQDGGIEWRAVRLRPGNQPIANLAAELAAALGDIASGGETHIASLEGRLRLGGLGLAEAVRFARLESHVRLLVVVDQFEELFRFKEMIDPEEAAAFVKLLLNAAHHPDSRVSVVLTLRSNALGSCADFHDLPEAINRGLYLVPRLTREQRKEAIVKPVELRGFRIAPRLVQRILNDVSDSFDELPVMQHVLARTWQHWAAASLGTRPIDLDDYEVTGTAKKALSNHADEAYKSLTGLDAVVERVFRALTERVSEGVEDRRPLQFDRLCAVVGGEKANVAEVVQRFHRPDTAFLMLSPDAALDADPVVDISHESLIRQWERLHGWAQEEAESRAMLLRLVDAAGRYAKGKGDLWHGRDLEAALKWWKNQTPTAPWISLCAGGDGAATEKLAQRFLSESEDAANSERKHRRRVRLGLRALAMTIVILSVWALIMAGIQRQAKSRELSNLALLEWDKDPARSAHHALAALDLDPENARGEIALRNSLAKLEIAHLERIVHFPDPIVDARLSSDGTRLVVAAGKMVTILDAGNYKRVAEPFSREENVAKSWLIANNKALLTQTADGQVQIQGVDDLRIHPLRCSGEKTSVYSIAVSGIGQFVATGCDDGEITVWDLNGSEPRRRFALASGATYPATVTALTFSFDEKYLASGDADGIVNIWKLGKSGPWIGVGSKGAKQSPIKHSKAIRDIAFYPTEPGLLATASDDSTAVVWMLDLQGRRLMPAKTGEQTMWTLKHERAVISARFAPRTHEGKDEYPLMTVSDKRVYVWIKEGYPGFRRHDDRVLDAIPSSDGEWIVSASNDRTARVWSARSRAPIAILRGHRDSVTRAFFGKDEEVVTAGQDGQLLVWRVRPPRLLAAVDRRWVLGIAFDDAYNNVAFCGERPAGGYASQCRISFLRKASGGQSAPKDLDPVENADAIGRISRSADGKLLLGHKGRLDSFQQIGPTLWDIESGKNVTPPWLREWTGASFSAARAELVTVNGYDGSVAVWDSAALLSEHPVPMLRFPAKVGWLFAELSPDGRWVAVIESNKIALLDRQSPASVPRLLIGHQGEIKAVKFSRDSRRLVTASADGTARIWQVNQSPGEPQEDSLPLTGGHTGALSYAEFDQAGARVVTSSADRTIRVWDAYKGREVAVLSWHGDSVNQAKFSSDGKNILSAGDDGLVLLGPCESCGQKVLQLRERVLKEAALPPDEIAEIQEYSRVAMPYFKMPQFLSQER